MAIIFATQRTDSEIVDQTNSLARICLAHLGTGYQAPADHKFYEAEDPRSKASWQRACEIMEFLTATDPNDALSNIEDDDHTQRKVGPERFLDLSTAHLSPAAKAWLGECGMANHAANYHGVGVGGMISTLGTTMCGWFMYAPDEEQGAAALRTMPVDLVAICRKARESDCAYILFDRDVDPVDDLPVFPEV